MHLQDDARKQILHLRKQRPDDPRRHRGQFSAAVLKRRVLREDRGCLRRRRERELQARGKGRQQHERVEQLRVVVLRRGGLVDEVLDLLSRLDRRLALRGEQVDGQGEAAVEDLP